MRPARPRRRSDPLVGARLLALLGSLTLGLGRADASPTADASPAADASPPAPALTRPPELLDGASPDYPDVLRRAGIGGTVVVRLLVSAAGLVESALVVRSVHVDLDAAALVAAQGLVFTPAEVDGAPAPVTIDYSFDFVPPPPQGDLAGRVLDHRGNPLADVLVSVVDSALEATTDADGAWQIADLPTGEHRVVLFRDTYARATETVLVERGERARFEAILLPATPGNETIVIGRRAWREVERAPLVAPDGAVVGSWELTARDVELTAGSMGDVARAVQKLPGVTGDSDFFATFHVRGGDLDETLFYLDGVPLQNPNHLGGVFTLFNPNLVDRITLHAGGPGAELGESLAGALEVTYIDGDAREFDGRFDVNMAMASAWLSGPLGKPGAPATFVVSGRRSFLEPYFGVMRAAGVLSRDAKFGLEFGEYVGRLTFGDATTRHRVRVGVTYSHDRMTFGTSDDPDDPALLRFSAALDTRNRLALGTLHWDWRLGPRVSWHQLVALSFDEADQTQEAAFGVTRRVNTMRPSWRSDLRLRFDDAGKHTLSAGLDLAYLSLSGDGTIKDPRSVPTWAAVPWADLGAWELRFNSRKESTELALYAQDDWQGLFGSPLHGRLGVRATVINALGKVLLSPRAALALPLPTGTTIKAAFALTHQIPRDPLVYDPVVGATDLKPQRAVQLSAAIEQLFPIGALVRVEAYHRVLSQLLVNPDTRAAVERGVSYASVGRGTASGIDVFFGLRGERFGVAATYSLGRSMRYNPLNEAGPQTFAPFFDQRHGVRIGGDVKLGKKKDWAISGLWEVRSGKPRSPVLHRLADDGERWITVPYAYNSESYGAFHELSLHIENSRVLKDRVKVTVYLDVLNTYNAQSQYVWIYGQGVVDEETGAREAPRAFVFRQLPIRPWFGFRAEW